jgi:hypothetical protein
MRKGLLQPPTEAPMPDGPMAAQPGAPVEAPQVDENGLEAATPEEQKQYDELMSAFFELLHTGKMKDQTVERLKAGADDIAQTIGNIALAIFSSIEGKIEKDGGSIADSVRLEAGEDLVSELVEMAVLMKLVEDDEDAIGVAMTGAIDVFASRYGSTRREAGHVDSEWARQEMEGMKPDVEQQFGGGKHRWLKACNRQEKNCNG